MKVEENDRFLHVIPNIICTHGDPYHTRNVIPAVSLSSSARHPLTATWGDVYLSLPQLRVCLLLRVEETARTLHKVTLFIGIPLVSFAARDKFPFWFLSLSTCGNYDPSLLRQLVSVGPGLSRKCKPTVGFCFSVLQCLLSNRISWWFKETCTYPLCLFNDPDFWKRPSVEKFNCNYEETFPSYFLWLDFKGLPRLAISWRRLG